jgi:hypothetical protein
MQPPRLDEYLSPRHRIEMMSAVVILLAVSTGCASHTPRISGSATSYERVGAAEGSDRIERIPIDPSFFSRFRNVVIDPVEITGDVAEAIEPETAAAIKTELAKQVKTSLAQHFMIVDHAGDKTLRIRLVVTRITEASPITNVITSLVLGPVRNGALAVEADILDAADGSQRGLYLWADEGSAIKHRQFGGYFRRAAHARQLTVAFGHDLAGYLAPLATGSE